MTAVRTHAHTFHAWFSHNSTNRIQLAVSNEGTCATLFDRYSDEIWETLSDYSPAYGGNVMETLGEHFGVDMTVSFSGFKTFAIRFVCEKLALESVLPVAA